MPLQAAKQRNNRREMLIASSPFLWSPSTKSDLTKTHAKPATGLQCGAGSCYLPHVHDICMVCLHGSSPSSVSFSSAFSSWCSLAASREGCSCTGPPSLSSLALPGPSSSLPYSFLSFIFPSEPYSLFVLLYQTEYKI